MISREEIQKLADLSRLSLSEADAAQYQEEVGAVLDYVSRVTDIDVSEYTKHAGAVHTVLREDGTPHEAGAYTEALLDAAPHRDGQYVTVKKVIQQ